MSTEVYEKTEAGGKVERELSELLIDPTELYFGTQFRNANNETEDSTTSTTYQQKITMSDDLVEGDSFVWMWYFEIKADLQNKNAAGRVQVNDTETIIEIEKEGNEWSPVTGFALFVAPSTGTYNADIDYRAIDGTAYIRRARLIGWRTTVPGV